jgi:hypothetical protein
MKAIIVILIVLVSCNSSNEQPYYDFETHFEISKGLETAT